MNSGKLGDNFRDSFGGGKNGLFGGGNSNAHGVIQGGEAEGHRGSSAQGNGVSNDNDYQQNAQQQQRAQDKFDKLAQNKLHYQGDSGSFNGGFKLNFNHQGVEAKGFFEGGSVFS